MRTTAFVLLATLTAFVAGCGKSAPSNSSDSGAAPPTQPAPQQGQLPQTDKDRLQGVWAVEKYEAGNPITAPPEAVRKTMRYIFQGNTLRAEAKSEVGSFGSSYSVVLDTASNPKVMIVAYLDENGRPLAGEAGSKMEWIYKLDGDVLVLAETSGKRPKEFTPKPSSGQRPGVGGAKPEKGESYVPGVDIVWLKKTNEAAPSKP